MKDQKAQGHLNTPNLSSYALSKALKALLARADQMANYMANGGRPAPSHIRLFRKDWQAVDKAVRQQSDGRYNARTVIYNGKALIPEGEEPKSFELESAA